MAKDLNRFNDLSGCRKMAMFLTRSELIDLTGYKKPSCMVRQLQSYGLRFFVAADGYPRVAVSEIEGGKHEKPKSRPDFSVLERINNHG